MLGLHMTNQLIRSGLSDWQLAKVDCCVSHNHFSTQFRLFSHQPCRGTVSIFYNLTCQDRLGKLSFKILFLHQV